MQREKKEMNGITEKCPKCGNVVEGKMELTTERKMTKAATKKGLGYFILPVVTGIIGTFIPIPIVGTLIGVFIGIWLNENVFSKAADALDQSMYTSSPFHFDCPACGHVWTKIYQHDADTTPDEVLKRQQEEVVRGFRSGFRTNVVCSVIFGVIGSACWYYCHVNEYASTHMEDVWLLGQMEVTDYNWTWFFLGFLMIVFLIVTVYNIIAAVNNFKEAKNVEGMTVEDFRHSVYRK